MRKVLFLVRSLVAMNRGTREMNARGYIFNGGKEQKYNMKDIKISRNLCIKLLDAPF